MASTYSNEDVQQIMHIASLIKQENEVSYEQLVDIAAEVGISAETLQQAEQTWLQQRDGRQQQTKRRSRRQLGFRLHLIPYIFVSLLLLIINRTTSPGHFWSIYPILGWGLGVTMHGACVYQKNSEV